MIHINIGSNLSSYYGSKFENISIATNLLIESKLKIKRISSFYETPSYPNNNLPRFINVGLIATYNYGFEKLIDAISLIEKKIGRIKSGKNSPRVCDIDIIDFKGLIKKNKRIIIPHPRAHLRNFVLYPIKQIDRNWCHPIYKKNVVDLIKELSSKSRIEITRLRKSVIM